MVPLSHGVIDNGKLGDAAVAPGIVTEAVADLEQRLPGPVTTSENW
jgi:hypothetical protein